MIDLGIPKHVIDFVEWLNAKSLSPVPCKLAYIGNLASLADNTGSGWAVYCWGENQIMLPGDMSKGILEDPATGEREEIQNSETEQIQMLLTNLAHEYCHHIQASEGREPLEDEADTFAYNTVVQYFNETNFDGRNDWAWEPLENPIEFIAH